MLSVSIGLKSTSPPQEAEKDQSEALVSSILFLNSITFHIKDQNLILMQSEPSCHVKTFSPTDMSFFKIYIHLYCSLYLVEHTETKFLPVILILQVHKK